MNTPPPPPPGHTLLFAGEWFHREHLWRPGVDIGTAPRHLIYAAGLADGYQNCVSDLAASPDMSRVIDMFYEHWQYVRLCRERTPLWTDSY